ncbi:amidohydrolase family protein [Xanthobacter sp. KR7-65]|uniref:amidohydrolase family protein n=1 Tax=Xanthobacter sp. KR7-65 TaxID=3156612 RepID=UPI0032B50CAE
MSEPPPLCLPPRPVDAAPAGRALPRGTCDTHMHVFGPLGRFPLSPTRNYTPREARLADYRKVMDALGIDRAVLVQPSVYGTDNSALMEALASDPARLRAVVVVPPAILDTDLAELDRMGARGIRINRRNPGGLSLDDFDSLAQRIAPLGWHIQLQVTLATEAGLGALVRRSPVPVVLDHLGFLTPGLPLESGPFRDLLELMAEGNIFVKLSAPYRLTYLSIAGPYADLLPYIAALVAVRPDRLLWASDWPHTEMFEHMPDSLDRALRLGLDAADEATRHAIFVANPARLYGFV